jgi:hypothetical protein
VGCCTCEGTVAGAAAWGSVIAFDEKQYAVQASFFGGDSSSSSISISSSESSPFSRLFGRSGASLSLGRFPGDVIAEAFTAVGGMKLGSSLRSVANDFVFA